MTAQREVREQGRDYGGRQQVLVRLGRVVTASLGADGMEQRAAVGAVDAARGAAPARGTLRLSPGLACAWCHRARNLRSGREMNVTPSARLASRVRRARNGRGPATPAVDPARPAFKAPVRIASSVIADVEIVTAVDYVVLRPRDSRGRGLSGLPVGTDRDAGNAASARHEHLGGGEAERPADVPAQSVPRRQTAADAASRTEPHGDA